MPNDNQRQPMSPRQAQRLLARSQVHPGKIAAILDEQQEARLDREETTPVSEYMKKRRRGIGHVVTK